jgi:hypothetical protein
MDLLSTIATKYGTDKVTHNFTSFYNEYLEGVRNEVKNVLEIGVFEGASLRMWEEYFPNANIFGFDENDSSFCNTQKIKTFVVNQSSIEEMQKGVNLTEQSSFDLIIDDGSHFIDDQQKSLGFLFQYVKRGGYFIMEDLHTSNFDLFPRWYNDTIRVNTLDMIVALKNNKLLYQYMTKEEANYILRNIKYVKIHQVSRGSITAIIKKY